MFHIALWEPEIPANTGNIGRLCVATGAELHLVGRTGFQLDDRKVRRAGLDYWSEVKLHQYPDLADFEARLQSAVGSWASGRLYCLSTRGSHNYARVRYQPGDTFLFGSETRGLPAEVLTRHRERALVLPMPGGKVRSLNLANAVAIVLYEALRQAHAWDQEPR